MKLEHPLAQDYDADDPLNAGVLADELVSNSSGTMIRRIRFIVPETGEVMEFLTNLGKDIAPGVIAQLYFMRWRIEKSFDEIKNKIHETKAWAMSDNAKQMQALFIITAYNLAQLLNEEIHRQDGETKQQDEISLKKRKQRSKLLGEKLNRESRELPLLRQIYERASQLSVKFYRWLRSHLYDHASWEEAQQRLRRIYAHF